MKLKYAYLIYISFFFYACSGVDISEEDKLPISDIMDGALDGF